MDNATVARLFKYSLAGYFNQWDIERPLRTGAPHASGVLVPESEWCVRKHVLLALFPDQAERPEHHSWDTLRNMRNKHGWVVHEKYQALLLKYAKVIYFNNNFDTPELDYTHFDETRNIFFSPDAIVEYGGKPWIIEIKGYKQETWLKMDEPGTLPITAHHQCNLYCHLLGIEQGMILVENKNTQELKTWAFAHDAQLATPYTDRMYEVKTTTHKAQRGEGLPMRQCCTSINDRQAQACPVRKLCFKEK